MDEVDEAEVLVEETDRACHPVQRVLDLLAGKQRAHDAEVFAEIADLHRVHAHHAHGGVASADAEKDAARSDPVDRRNRVSGYRRDARAGDGHARAEFDALAYCALRARGWRSNPTRSSASRGSRRGRSRDSRRIGSAASRRSWWRRKRRTPCLTPADGLAPESGGSLVAQCRDRVESRGQRGQAPIRGTKHEPGDGRGENARDRGVSRVDPASPPLSRQRREYRARRGSCPGLRARPAGAAAGTTGEARRASVSFEGSRRGTRDGMLGMLAGVPQAG